MTFKEGVLNNLVDNARLLADRTQEQARRAGTDPANESYKRARRYAEMCAEAAKQGRLEDCQRYRNWVASEEQLVRFLNTV